jgi:hypothetical protein
MNLFTRRGLLRELAIGIRATYYWAAIFWLFGSFV